MLAHPIHDLDFVAPLGRDVEIDEHADHLLIFSTFTQGKALRSLATRSRKRVNTFSFVRCALRALSQSSLMTTACCIIC